METALSLFESLSQYLHGRKTEDLSVTSRASSSPVTSIWCFRIAPNNFVSPQRWQNLVNNIRQVSHPPTPSPTQLTSLTLTAGGIFIGLSHRINCCPLFLCTLFLCTLSFSGSRLPACMSNGVYCIKLRRILKGINYEINRFVFLYLCRHVSSRYRIYCTD
jgi:hypothetical protein